MATPDLLGIVVNDMAAALKFYRLLGLDIPGEMDDQQHVEFKTPTGFRVAWDTKELMVKINGQWPEPTGHRMGFAMLCDSPAEVDALYNQVITAGYDSHKKPWDAFWGDNATQSSSIPMVT